MSVADPYPFIREIRSPLSSAMVEPLDPRCRVVQFSAPLLASEYIQVSRLVSEYPSVTLRAYGDYKRQFANLNFLEHFPLVRNFQADLLDLQDWTGLDNLPADASYIGLGPTRKSLSLVVLQRFHKLTNLYLDGHIKEIDVLSVLSSIEILTLRSISLPDLSLLVGMRQLWSLGLKLGGTSNLGLLPDLLGIKYLELWMVRGLTDLTPVGSLRSLQSLFLQALRRVTALPDMSQLGRLRRVFLDTMRGLTDLHPLATAPALEEAAIVAMAQLQPVDFQCLVGHPSLHHLIVGLGSLKKNHLVAGMFPNLHSGGPLPTFQFQ